MTMIGSGGVAPEDYAVQRAIRRWVAGEGEMAALIDEELARMPEECMAWDRLRRSEARL